jgi:hypothetical protein
MEEKNNMVPGEFGNNKTITPDLTDLHLELINIMENKPKLTKYDLRIGNMFKEGVVCKVSGRTGAKVALHGKLFYKKGELKQINTYFIHELTPIPLTPEILTEWCGFKSDEITFWHEKSEYLHLGNFKRGLCFISAGKLDMPVLEIKYLHELQNLWYVLNKSELEIKG